MHYLIPCIGDKVITTETFYEIPINTVGTIIDFLIYVTNYDQNPFHNKKTLYVMPIVRWNDVKLGITKIILDAIKRYET